MSFIAFSSQPSAGVVEALEHFSTPADVSRVGHILFLDESGNASEGGFVLGGVAVEMARWQELTVSWWRRPEAIAPGLGREIKWQETKSPYGKAAHLIDLLSAAGAVAFAVVVDSSASRAAEPALFATPEDEYATALMFIAERFQRHLERVDSHGLIVIDQRNRGQNNALRQFFDQIAMDGTPFRALDRLLTPILFSSSDDALGIQAADIVVGPLHALTRGAHPEVSEARRDLARELHERVRGCFDRHPATGEVEGVGIKRFPGPPTGDARRLFAARLTSA